MLTVRQTVNLIRRRAAEIRASGMSSLDMARKVKYQTGGSPKNGAKMIDRFIDEDLIPYEAVFVAMKLAPAWTEEFGDIDLEPIENAKYNHGGEWPARHSSHEAAAFFASLFGYDWGRNGQPLPYVSQDMAVDMLPRLAHAIEMDVHDLHRRLSDASAWRKAAMCYTNSTVDGPEEVANETA